MISIVIPVYNAEKSLEKCLDSILNQTYTEYEVILINDGSKDNSLKILDQYREEYPKIFRTYNQENKGSAVTRNEGIEYARGEYIFFIDCDDYIEKEYIETFVKGIEEKNVDMLIGGYKRVRLDSSTIFRREATDNPWTKYMMVAPWARVYRKEALKKYDIKFLDSNIWEDVYFNIVANLKLRIGTTSYNGYNWVYNENSFSNTTQKKLNPFVNLTEVFTIIKKDTDSISIAKDEKEYLEYFFIKACVWYLIHSGKGVEYKTLKEEYLKLFNWLEYNFPNYYKNKQIGIFKPKGEVLSVRIVVSSVIFLRRIALQNIFLKFLSII